MNISDFYDQIANRVKDALLTAFRNTDHIEAFMEQIEDRGSGGLLKYLEDITENSRREEEENRVDEDEIPEIDDATAQEQLARLRELFEKNKNNTLEECAQLPPCYGSIWRLKRNVKDIFPIPDIALLVETPEEGDKVVQAIPLHYFPDLAVENDLVFQKCAFHTDLVASLWNEQPVAIERLEICNGHLTDAELDILDAQLLEIDNPEPTKLDTERSILTLMNPKAIFQEFMLLATTPLRVEALDILRAQEEENEAHNVVLFDWDTVLRKLEKKHKAMRIELSRFPAALAALGDTEKPKAFVPISIKDPKILLHISQPTKNSLRIEVAGGAPDAIEGMKGAVILDADGKELATLTNLKADIKHDSDAPHIKICIRLRDGQFITEEIPNE